GPGAGALVCIARTDAVDVCEGTGVMAGAADGTVLGAAGACVARDAGAASNARSSGSAGARAGCALLGRITVRLSPDGSSHDTTAPFGVAEPGGPRGAAGA